MSRRGWFRLSPIGQRRLAQFRANRRGFVSFWLFLGVFCISMAADLIANHRPLLVRYDGAFYFPTLVSYPETTFGGFFETEADYGDPAVVELIEEKGWLLRAPVPYRYDSVVHGVERAPSPPSRQNILGTDDQSRDVFARVIYGLRLSILFGLLLTVSASAIGITVGAIQGYYGGGIDLVGQRLIEVWNGLPLLYLLIILASFIVPGFWTLLFIMLLFSWMALVDIVRAEFYRARSLDYVRAARALGATDFTVMRRHILPNAMVSSLALMPFVLSGALTTLTALDFLGFGLPPGSPSLGELLAQGKNNLQAPWLGITGFVVTGVILTLLIFAGEAVRDAFDPRRASQVPIE
ncbi:MAG TPA: ABC transporter permease [Geminicoccus sp.]|uniref:ABC transporter permease n=1 Tax=Geminicoccus sp. TaxID=2024832 RepID=UPI002E37FE33|nr:ABC transporter permease [Geminicoccus sp.]HEX2529383.1 ABC transporter permease [Geminicoccus sp.]